MKLASFGLLLLAASAAHEGRSQGADVPVTAAPKTAVTSALDPERCDHRPVIMVISGTMKDGARLAAYVKALSESRLYDVLGGYYLNSSRSVATFEGSPPPNHLNLLVRFPCLAHARAFWYSTRYQRDILPLRTNPSAGDLTITVHPEIAPPDFIANRLEPGGYSWKPTDDVVRSIPRVGSRP